MATDAKRIEDAAARFGPSVDHIAARYTNPVTGERISGTQLLRKVLEGEARAISNPGGARNAVSSAGARGWGQFMPSSRAIAVKKYGVDPWRSPEESVHATALHLRGKINGSTGLEGYNPGMPTYPSYILQQRVGPARGRGGSGGGSTRVSGGDRPGPGGSRGMPAFDANTGGALAAQLRAAIADLQQSGPAPIPAGAPPAPEFATAPVMPEFHQTTLPSGGPAPVRGEDPALAELEALAQRAEAPSFGTPERGPDGAQGGRSGSGGSNEAVGRGGLRLGGGYEGTEQLAHHARFQAEKRGWSSSGPGQRKRATRNTATGGVSDHFQGKANAWAEDYGNGSQTENREGHELARSIAKRYGVKYVPNSYQSGGTIKVADKKVRVQILYGNEIDHGDHVHVGFEVVG